jgi:hypothetical protein
MALVAILTGNVNLYVFLPWMATRAIPTISTKTNTKLVFRIDIARN